MWRSKGARGFEGATAVRAMPPVVVGGGGVSDLNLYQYGSGVETQVRLVCLTADGLLTVWDLARRVRTARVSVAPAIHSMHHRGSPSLPTLSRTFLSVTSPSPGKEPPLLILLHQPHNPGGGMQGFYYSPGMDAWLRVSDGRFSTSSFHSSSSLRSRMSGSVQATALAKLDSYASKGTAVGPGEILAARNGGGTVEGRERARVEDRGHCEEGMAAAVAVGERRDYEYWLGEYCRHLAEEGDEGAFRDIVEEMGGDVWDGEGEEEGRGGGGRRNACWWSSDCKVLGIDPKEAIRMVVKEMTANRTLQPLVGEINARLELAEMEEE